MKNPIFTFLLMCFSLPVIHAQLICKDRLNLSLSFDGTGELSPIDLLDSPLNPALSYSMSESRFNCADVGFTYEITVGEFNEVVITDICASLVTIEDKFDHGPCDVVEVPCTEIMEPFVLSSAGELTLTADQIAGQPLNPAYDYTVSQEHFDCSDVGIQNVVVTAIGANGMTASCTNQINIVRPAYPIFTCLRFSLRDIRFFPSGIFANIINPGNIIPFELGVEKSLDIKKAIPANLSIVLSKDEEISKDDILLFAQNMQFTPKDFIKNIKGKLQMPSHLSKGNYYLLMDMTTSAKKERIGFEKYVLPVTIGYSENKSITTENRDKDTITEIKISPNPFDHQLHITQLSANTPSTIVIMDMTGKVWTSMQTHSESITLNTSNLTGGLYWVKIISDHQPSQIFKLVKTH